MIAPAACIGVSMRIAAVWPVGTTTGSIDAPLEARGLPVGALARLDLGVEAPLVVRVEPERSWTVWRLVPLRRPGADVRLVLDVLRAARSRSRFALALGLPAICAPSLLGVHVTRRSPLKSATCPGCSTPNRHDLHAKAPLMRIASVANVCVQQLGRKRLLVA